MARYSKTLTPEAQAAFVARLRGGATVAAAARAVGVALSTLYWRRARDPDFADAWTIAVETGADPAPPGKRRRNRFAGWRREAFLDQLERTCDTKNSAAAAGVHKATVHRHIARDPGFARANAATLERGYRRLESEAEQEREAARLDYRELEPAGPVPGDFDTQFRLLERWGRPDGSVGPRRAGRGRKP